MVRGVFPLFVFFFSSFFFVKEFENPVIHNSMHSHVF